MKPAARFFTLLFAWLLYTGCQNREQKNPLESPANKKDSSRLMSPVKNENPYSIVDISPMDMSYYPADYPILKMTKAIQTLPQARLIYSRPHLQGRRLFQNLLKYGEPWRLGANESTELDLYGDTFIQDQKIKAGRYVLYCIPEPETWTIVLNANIDSWGLQPDTARNITRFTIPVRQTANRLEYFTMVFEKTDSGADLLMAWDNLEARLPFRF
jgi:hypothetical protein